MPRRPLARSALFAAFYLAGMLAFLEAGLRIALGFDPLVRRLVGSDDASQRLHWVKLREKRQTFVYAFDVHHPTRGWAVEPNVRDRVVFKDRILNSNSRGLRGTAEHSYERVPGRRRILALGDSFTFGDDVSDDETWSHFLQGELPATEVLNMGVHGYGHDQMLIYLLEEGVRYRPDFVILGFVWFDMNRNLFEFNNYAKPKYELRDGKLRLAVASVPPPEWFLEREPWRLRLADVAVMMREKLRWRLGLNDVRARELSGSILAEMAAAARAAGATPVFVYLPVLKELENRDEAKSPNERFLEGVCDAHQVACHFLRPEFAAEASKGINLNARGHWRAQEHRIAARAIARHLAARPEWGADGR